jgi:hypothetical protein
MRRMAPFILLAIALAGAVYFFTTARLVGRHLLTGLPSEPNAFEGPELAAGYILQRGLRGPESYIENPAGERVMPPPGVSPTGVGVVRLAVHGHLILGEIAVLDSGDSRGYFVIDTRTREVTSPRPEAAWHELVRSLLNAEPPPLIDADSFPGPAPPP